MKGSDRTLTSGLLNRRLLVLIVMLMLYPCIAAAVEKISQDQCESLGRYTFSWSYGSGCEFLPRGGTTQGPAVTYDPNPHPGWQSLQQAGLSSKSKDRSAILAMAGPYQVSFDFLETVIFDSEVEPDRPYQSWGTEYVYVIEDQPDLISLQHIMVMYFDQDGTTVGPFVMKHWRQDWAYQQPWYLEYQGDDIWQKRQIPSDELEGVWVQSVFQVDDSPRYASYGRWEHYSNFSTWKSQRTKRPLPRRESSVRNDYDILEGFNRHSILHDGWVQEEENRKRVVNEAPSEDGAHEYVSKELGVARYRRIIEHDFSAGDEYWQLTGDFWAKVRDTWNNTIVSAESIQFTQLHDGQTLFELLFTLADEFGESKLDRKEVDQLITDAISIRTVVSPRLSTAQPPTPSLVQYSENID